MYFNEHLRISISRRELIFIGTPTYCTIVKVKGWGHSENAVGTACNSVAFEV